MSKACLVCSRSFPLFDLCLKTPSKPFPTARGMETRWVLWTTKMAEEMFTKHAQMCNWTTTNSFELGAQMRWPNQDLLELFELPTPGWARGRPGQAPKPNRMIMKFPARIYKKFRAADAWISVLYSNLSYSLNTFWVYFRHPMNKILTYLGYSFI